MLDYFSALQLFKEETLLLTFYPLIHQHSKNLVQLHLCAIDRFLFSFKFKAEK
jgi:hypothetical protein